MQRLLTGRLAWLVVVVVALCIIMALYRRWSDARAWQTALQVPVAGFQPGTVRLAHGLWVARQADGEFRVFLNQSDFYRDRPLRWVAPDGQFEEPISSARYGIDGTGQFGPAGQLYRVESRLDGATLLALPNQIISGGPGDPAWLTDLKHFFTRPRPHPPASTP